MAVPRVDMRGASGVGLPQPLSAADVGLIRRIFSLQAGGSVAEAARETERLQNDLLLGPILADRYERWKSSAAELSAWLARFGDQPDAATIRGILERVSPGASVSQTEPPAQVRARFAPSQARSLFVQNRDADALAAARAPRADAEAQFVGGLAAVRLGQRDVAAGLFEAAYREADTEAVRAGGAFWAAWVARHGGDRGRFTVWMRRAAMESDTFYGLIARRALGPAVACTAQETIGNADVEALLATPQGRRAFALLQVGEDRRAETELRALWIDTVQDGLFDHSLLVAARAMGFAPLAADIEQRGAARPDASNLVRLRPANGFVVDPPLVYALVRHESNFQAGAVSRSGAQGLMQLMPRTAHAVAGEEARRLHDPAVNLAIGQKYLLALAEDEAIDGDLIRVLVGFNQGQGGLRKWVDAVRDDGDPLMFVEAIPNPHTRASVQDALVYTWHYAAALNLPASSLDALAAGRYPRLVAAGEERQAAGRACRRVAAAR
jgi:soluble lytic murein transglycosylase-like protein